MKALLLSVAACLSIVSLPAHARPRPPLPPFPEAAVLDRLDFNAPFYAGATNEFCKTADGELHESWSGYALTRSGDSVTPLVISALDGNGKTNVACGNGAIRFWFKPHWTSASLAKNGGPGVNARLVEFTVLKNNSLAVNWSLYTDEEGSTIFLSGQNDFGATKFFQADIAWQSDEWHLLTLNYGVDGTALFIDGKMGAQGSGVPGTSAAASGVVIGSTFLGTDTAGGEFDEVYFFARPLTEKEHSFYFDAMSGTAFLGPISPEEEAEWKAAAKARQQEKESQLLESESHEAYRMNGIIENCPTNGPVYITNIFCTFSTNGSSTVTFDIVGGTNGIYDIFMATHLVGDSITNGNWIWLERGYTCNSYIFTNQPAEYAFYVLGDSTIDPDGDGISTAYELLSSKTDANSADTDNDGIPDGWEVQHGLNPLVDDASEDPDDDGLTNLQEYQGNTNPFDNMLVIWGDNLDGESTVPWGFGPVTSMAGGGSASAGGHTLVLMPQRTVTAWGANYFGQTNTPFNLSNVVAVVAGGDQSAALKSDGTVAQWGRSFTNIPSGATNVVEISAGYQHLLALKMNGTVLSWGRSNSPANEVPAGLNNVKAIGAGWNHNVALRSNGTITAWGLNAQSLNWNLTNVPSGLADVAAISVGALHSVALRGNGTVVAWGNNAGGETNVPTGLSNAVSIAAGRGYTLALRADGTVIGWGLGLPGIPAGLDQVKKIAAGPAHAFAVRQGILTPIIVSQPKSQGAAAGGSVTFRVRASSRREPSYQWQKDGTNIIGATNIMLVISNVQSNSQGYYRVFVSNGAGTTVSEEAQLALVGPPVIMFPTTLQNIWVPQFSNQLLSVIVTAQGSTFASFHYDWFHNGQTNSLFLSMSNLSLFAGSPASEGQYWVIVSNIAGRATSSVWTVRMMSPGSVAVWGTNNYGQFERPLELTNTVSIAGGATHCLAVAEEGNVFAWGGSNFGETNVPSGLTNALSVAAGNNHSLALRSDGTVVAWGRNNDGQTNGPTGLNNATAIAAGGNQSMALRSNGTVTNWGNTFGTIPSNLTNAIAIAAGTNFCLALRSNETIAAWGNNDLGQTNVPVAASNVVAVAAGTFHALALRKDGHVISWGSRTDVPADLTNAMAIAAGNDFSVALRNNGTVIAWGGNSSGQTNVITNLPPVKIIASGGSHALAALFSPLVQYPVDVSKELLLIYNTNSADSTFVKDYYLAHRPMVANANVLGLDCPTNEIIDGVTFTNDMLNPYLSWLNQNPTKHPEYIVVFLDVATRVHSADNNNGTSLSVRLRDQTPGIKPYVTHINMGGTNDCKGYIDKLEYIGTTYSPGKVIISAGDYGNTNFVVDNIRYGAGICSNCNFSAGGSTVSVATNGLIANGISPNAIIYADGLETGTNAGTNIVYSFLPHLTGITNVAGYICWGEHSSLQADYATNGVVHWHGSSKWWIIQTIESDNGLRISNQGNFTRWFSSNAFGGTNYSNTPVGAVTHVEEPQLPGVNDAYIYFGLWAAEKNFVTCAWQSRITPFFQAVGDPLIVK